MGSDEKASRSVTRTILNTLVFIVSIGVLGGWAWQGIYRLEPGESAVILQFGALDRIVSVEGMHLHFPPPIEYHEIVNTSGLRAESFGARPSTTTPGVPADAEETEIAREMRRDAIQTADSNIINVAYELQYKVADAYAFAFGMEDPASILHDSTEAVIRDVIGSRTIDAVLSQDRGDIELEAKAELQKMLDSYFEAVGLVSAFRIDKINLQKPQAPEPVREAFADVVSAGQDEKRSLSTAAGDAQEILENARAEAAELREKAEAYKQARIIEARGEAARFTSLQAEYAAAPEVTRRRLYIETMEEILPDMQKMIVESDGVNMLPTFPTFPTFPTRQTVPPIPVDTQASSGGAAQ
jgi:membrane protease subunit HflK